jgi:regulator of sigma E protease
MDLLSYVLTNLWSVLLIAVFFGGSIFVHELGHFLAARRRGVVVERFSIGFGPKIFSWTGKDGVEYRLSWLPLGGYVALPQLADMRGIEGESTKDWHALPPPSYATKMIVFGAGAFFNILFAFALACIVWGVGQPTTTSLNSTRIGVIAPTLTLPDGRIVKSPAAEAGIQVGDVIRAVDGKPVDNWLGFMQTLAAGAGRTHDDRREARLTIERDGKTLDVIVHPLLAGDDGFRTIGVETADTLVVGRTLPDSPAAAAGLIPGDILVHVDGQTVASVEEFIAMVQKSAGSPVTLTVQRGAQTLRFPVTPRLGENRAGKQMYLVGIEYRHPSIIIHPTPLKQVLDHATMTWRVLSGLLNPNSDLGPSKLSGPVGIARGFHSMAQVDIRLVLWFTILVNVNLAIFNLLPIPVLDGGHMAFATIAKLRGRNLPPQFIAATQQVFMVLLFTMIIYVSSFDIRRWIRDARADRTPAEAPAAPVAVDPAK